MFGDRPLTLREFELYSWIQGRVLLAATEEGRRDLSLDAEARLAAELEAGADPQAALSRAALDPEAMTPAELEAWTRRQAGAW